MIFDKSITTIMLDNTIQQIEQFHTEWSRMDLGAKMSLLVRRQIELNAWMNSLANTRIHRGYFTPEEQAAVRLLQDIQNDLDNHKSEVNHDIYNEIRKTLFKSLMSLR